MNHINCSENTNCSLMKFAASLWCFYDLMTSHLLDLHQLTLRKQLTVGKGSLFKWVLFKRLSQDRKLPESVSEKQRSSDHLHHQTDSDLHLLNPYLPMAWAVMDQNCSEEWSSGLRSVFIKLFPGYVGLCPIWELFLYMIVHSIMVFSSIWSIVLN